MPWVDGVDAISYCQRVARDVAMPNLSVWILMFRNLLNPQQHSPQAESEVESPEAPRVISSVNRGS